MKSAVAILLLFLAAAGCDNSFSPKANSRREPVLYLVLDRTQPFQILRYSAIYNPPGVIPGEYAGSKDPGIRSAVVVSLETEDHFTDTLLRAPDGALVPAMICRTLHPRSGAEYRLIVQLTDGTSAEATIQVPPEPGLALNGSRNSLYIATDASTVDLKAETAAREHNPPTGSYFRMWFTFWKKNGGGGLDTLREEIPTGVSYTSGGKEYAYPRLDRGTDQIYPLGALRDILRTMIARGDTNFVGLKCTGYCLERNFYSYVKVLRGFDDPLSIRAENPNFTNISGGLGLFGAVVTDSISLPFPWELLQHLY